MEKNEKDTIQKEKDTIQFDIGATELLHYSCKGIEKNNITERDLFIVDNKWYYLYAYTRTEKVPSYSLREITSEEYQLRKKDIFRRCPNSNVTEWQDSKGNCFSIKFYQPPQEECMFSKNILTSACVFITDDNPLKKIHDRLISDKILKEEQEAISDKEKRYSYSRECGGLSNRYGISFINVLRLGTNVNVLKKFKESYDLALKNAPLLSLEEQRFIYQSLFQDKTRASRVNALKKLKIDFSDADVRNMDFKELETILINNLNAYVEESEIAAIKTALELDYEKREEIYIKINLLSRSSKREGLAMLGVNVKAININFYPLMRIRQTLARSLGSDFEI